MATVSSEVTEEPGDRSRPGAEPSAKSLLTTLLGEFVLPADGGVWTSTLLDGLTELGFAERNIRQAIARLGDDGVVTSERHGRRARWVLTDDGTRLLDTGSERIYSFGDRSESWDGSWIVVLCQIPETRRRTRHQFRARMAFAGFGFLTPTTALSPHRDREDAANAIVTALGIDDAVVFRAETGTLSDDGDLLAQAWDLDGLADEYVAFVDEFDAAAPVDAAEAFAWTVRLVDAWRRFPFIDPELPDGLMPEGWIGIRARELFERRRAEWHAPAHRWFADREASA